MESRKNQNETRAKIIAAAGSLFAERGYDAVSIRDIVLKADVSLGTVNYHFRNKEGLYRETLTAACESTALNRSQIAELGQLPAQTALTIYIREFIKLGGSPQNWSWEMLLLRREYALPGPFFKEIFGTCSRAELAFLAEQIGCLAGVEPQSPDVEFAAATLFSQLNMLALDKNLMSQVIPDLIEYTGTHPDWLTEKLLRQLNSIVKA